MVEIDRSAPVLVTGASGYVAGWLVKTLLDAGLTVHGTVRDPSNEAKTEHLRALAEGAPGTLRLFAADLLEDGSFAEAMAGCALVFHTASPFKNDVTDPQRELVDPAVQGTRNVLEESKRVAAVKRVVVTSSCAAIYGDNADVQEAPNGVLTEEVWNESSSLEHQPYSYSKTLAEREAWRIAESQDAWDLVTVNPSFVMGPGIKAHKDSESYSIMKQLVDGSMKTGAPKMGIGVVDVRDVAQAHYQAGFTASASGRYITSGHNSDLAEFGPIIRAQYGKRYPVPGGTLPKWLVWLVGPMINPAMTRRMVSRNMSLPFRADNGKSRRELGIEYRPLERTVIEFFDHVVDAEGLRKDGAKQA